MTRGRALMRAARLGVWMLGSLLAASGAVAQVSGSTHPPNAPLPPEEAKPGIEAPENIEVFKPGMATAILGKRVLDVAGKDMGMVVDVLVDREARVRAAVIDFGGFLGVGSRKIAIDWRLLQFNPDNRDAAIVLALSRAEVQEAPEYKPGSQLTKVVAPPPPPERSATVGE